MTHIPSKELQQQVLAQVVKTPGESVATIAELAGISGSAVYNVLNQTPTGKKIRREDGLLYPKQTATPKMPAKITARIPDAELPPTIDHILDATATISAAFEALTHERDELQDRVHDLQQRLDMIAAAVQED